MPEVADAHEERQLAGTHSIRVRSDSARLTALIAEATERSATFRDLIARIDASDGIVRIEEGRCPHGLLACLPWRVTLAGSYRILFVYLHAARSDVDVIVSMGHELRHALEVLDDPSLRSDWAIRQFYLARLSWNSPTPTPETRAAIKTGEDVYREIRRSRNRGKR
jgi:hypothetical protein